MSEKKGKNRYIAEGTKKPLHIDYGWIAIAALVVIAVTLAIFAVMSGKIDIGDGYNGDIPAASDICSYVHFIDVGQGDCELIVADDGSAMLIDGGEKEYGSTVLEYIRDLEISKLDYIVATHPHSDHIGGLSKVISSEIEVGKVIMPYIPDEFVPTTKSYERLLTAIDDKGIEAEYSKNQSFPFGGGMITIIQTEYSGDNYNNYSTLVKYEYKGSAFLFTGDLEATQEMQLVNAGTDIYADVLKVGHHGSATSSCQKFLEAVSPEYCVIECDGVSYNHPNPDVVSRLKKNCETVLRTDKNGSVVFTCTDSGLSFDTEIKDE